MRPSLFSNSETSAFAATAGAGKPSKRDADRTPGPPDIPAQSPSSSGRGARRSSRSRGPELNLATERSRVLTDGCDMLSIAGFDGYFKQLNYTWRSVLGFPEEELKAKPFLDFVHPLDRSLTSEYFEHLKTNDFPVYFENRFACRDGSYRWLAWTAAPLFDEKLLYLFARDITERKRSEEEVRDLNKALAVRADELERANRELEREVNIRQQAETALKEINAELEAFSYSVSHDLRAPLRAMQGFAEALLEDCAEGLSDIGKEYASRVVTAARRMDTLVQDLLLYSRISHNQVPLQTVDLRAVVADAMRQLEAPLRDTQASIVVQEPLPRVVGHHATLVQVVSNLLSNAVKFIDRGVQPSIQISAEMKDGQARLWIADNGIGIDPQYHTRIFRVFERLHGVEEYPGTGIGLAIVRKALERMGGSVGVNSLANRGSQFWIELPLGAQRLDEPAVCETPTNVSQVEKIEAPTP